MVSAPKSWTARERSLRFKYRATHVTLETSTPSKHRVTVPARGALKVGTPAKILKEVEPIKAFPGTPSSAAFERGETTLSDEVRY
jgi:hypothetical protein